MKSLHQIKTVFYSIYDESFCKKIFSTYKKSTIGRPLRELAKGQSMMFHFTKDKKYGQNAMKLYRLLQIRPADIWSFNFTKRKDDQEKYEIISQIVSKQWDFFRHGVTEQLYTYEDLWEISNTNLKDSYAHYLKKYESLDDIEIRNKCYEIAPKLELYDVSWKVLNKEELTLLLQRMEKAYVQMKEIKQEGDMKDGRQMHESEFYDEGLY